MRIPVVVEDAGPLDDESEVNHTEIVFWPPWMERVRHELSKSVQPTPEAFLAASARLAYSVDQMRDEHGRFAGDGVSSPAGGKGTKEDPYRVKSAELAQKLIHSGKYVEMPSDQVSVLLDRLAAISREARAAGTKAPLYDLCKVSVPDTNMFCAGTKDIPRVEMPQLAGFARPGTDADALPKDSKGETDITSALIDKLAADGVSMDDLSVPADTLRATQNELNGAKVAGMMGAIHDGTLPPGRIFVSRENYVVDGHHRWAANVGEGFVSGQPLNMDVTRVDMPIAELIEYVNTFASDLGMQQMQASVRLAYSEDQSRDEAGKFGEGGGGTSAPSSTGDRPVFAGTTVEPVQLLADGKASYNEAHGLDAPSDRDWSSVMADPGLGAQIAADYEAMQDYNPAAEPAYDALASEVSAQFDHLTNELGITVEFTNNDPYHDVAGLKADIENNGHLGVLSTDATPPGHPYLTNEQNDQFRAVHDAFGHAAIGRSFDRNGEEAAFQSHAEMFTSTALPALASETRGQNSALNFGGYGARGEFPPQKFDVLPTSDLRIPELSLVAAMTAAVRSADDDNLYSVSGSHHVSMGRSFKKPPNPPRPAPSHTSLGRHGTARQTAAVDGSPTPSQVKRTIARLHTARQQLGRKLLAGAEVTLVEALRRAGVKVATRTRNRGTSKTVQAQVVAALNAGTSLRPLLGALGLKEHDLLAGAFVSYETQSALWMVEYRKRQAAILEAAGYDPADFGIDDEGNPALAGAAAGFIVAGLMALARGRLLGGVDHVTPGEVAGLVPAGYVLPAIRVAEGTATGVLGQTFDERPTIGDLPDMSSVEDGLASLVDGQTMYTWVHAFYGDPVTPFIPHEDLGASDFTTADPTGDPDLAIGESFPDGDYYQPGDHDGCTCEWVISSPGG